MVIEIAVSSVSMIEEERPVRGPCSLEREIGVEVSSTRGTRRFALSVETLCQKNDLHFWLVMVAFGRIANKKQEIWVFPLGQEPHFLRVAYFDITRGVNLDRRS
jgi:hypothetical protein